MDVFKLLLIKKNEVWFNIIDLERISFKPTLKELCKDEDLRNEVIELVSKSYLQLEPNTLTKVELINWISQNI
jgi:hypothetical protein